MSVTFSSSILQSTAGSSLDAFHESKRRKTAAAGDGDVDGNARHDADDDGEYVSGGVDGDDDGDVDLASDEAPASSSSSSSSSAVGDDDESRKRKRLRDMVEREFESYDNERLSEERGFVSSQARGEVEIRVRADVLDCWRALKDDFPAMALLARVVLVVSASQMASERMFSRAGRIFRGDRCRMRGVTLKELVLIAINGRIVGLLK